MSATPPTAASLNLAGNALTPGAQRSWWLREALARESGSTCPPLTGDVTAEARQFPRVRLRTTVTFEPIAAGTRVTEHMRIEAPRVLAAMTTSEAVKAHTAMLAGMRRSFE